MSVVSINPKFELGSDLSDFSSLILLWTIEAGGVPRSEVLTDASFVVIDAENAKFSEVDAHFALVRVRRVLH